MHLFSLYVLGVCLASAIKLIGLCSHVQAYLETKPLPSSSVGRCQLLKAVSLKALTSYYVCQQLEYILSS